ncbi:MAG: TetR/AcrR family transcriptional regulator [Calditrichia bacterium]
MAFSPKIDIRRKILDTARQLLVEKGITNVSIRMIAGKVGCSVGTIYFYFQNKDALVHSLIEEGFEKLISVQEKVAETISDPLQRLKELCRNYINFAIDNPEYYEIMFMLHAERMSRYPAEKYRRAFKSLDMLSNTLIEGADQGELVVGDAGMETQLIWSHMHGIVSLILTKRIHRSVEHSAMIELALDQIVETRRRHTVKAG